MWCILDFGPIGGGDYKDGNDEILEMDDWRAG
jgi:hypothetical protein